MQRLLLKSAKNDSEQKRKETENAQKEQKERLFSEYKAKSKLKRADQSMLKDERGVILDKLFREKDGREELNAIDLTFEINLLNEKIHRLQKQYKEKKKSLELGFKNIFKSVNLIFFPDNKILSCEKLSEKGEIEANES